jgi:hypothetical protein
VLHGGDAMILAFGLTIIGLAVAAFLSFAFAD